MRRALTLAALLLPLAGCYVPPGADGYSDTGYQGVAYADRQDVYAGYDYNGGSRFMNYEGAQVPLVFFGGYWGFYDGSRRFHRAPDSVGRHLESRHPEGSGARPYGGRVAAPPYNGSYQAAPRPRYDQNTSAQANTAPRTHTAPVYAAPASHTAPPAHTAAPAAPTAAPTRHEEHRDHRCRPDQTHC
jgi:hypothetical protein